MIEKQFFDMSSNLQRKVKEEDNDKPNVNSSDGHQRKRKRYHRHTMFQTQQLEAFFKECPHPDDRQKKELGRQLGMEELQIKFWFQNKRTQMKSQHERKENSLLRSENEKLRAENVKYREALSYNYCAACGSSSSIGDMTSDERHLRMENARLKEEVDRIAALAAKYVGKPMPFSSSSTASSSSAAPPPQHSP